MTIENFRNEVKRLAEELASDGVLVHRVIITPSEDYQAGGVTVRMAYEEITGGKVDEK